MSGNRQNIYFFNNKKTTLSGYSFGAPSREHFEHISKLVRAMDNRQAIGLIQFYYKHFNPETGLLDNLTENQKKFYQIA